MFGLFLMLRSSNSGRTVRRKISVVSDENLSLSILLRVLLSPQSLKYLDGIFLINAKGKLVMEIECFEHRPTLLQSEVP